MSHDGDSEDLNCESFDSLREFFVEGHPMTGWDCAMTGGDPQLQLLFGAMLFGSVGLSLFITTGSLVIPSVLAILFAGVIFALLPPTVVNLLLVALLLSLSAAGFIFQSRIGGR